jgi:hypothetical protein
MIICNILIFYNFMANMVQIRNLSIIILSQTELRQILFENIIDNSQVIGREFFHQIFC